MEERINDYSENEVNDEQPFLDRNIFSSTNISFLFGAGINGMAFPQLSGFKKTNEIMSNIIGDSKLSFEEAMDSIDDPTDHEKVEKTFLKEFRDHEDSINYSHDSIRNIESLLESVYKIVSQTQNRNIGMKQINIYSLNYDRIVEHCVDKLGYFYNSVSASNITQKSYLFDVIGYDYKSKTYVPSFLISKVHGDINNPIIPGKRKYVQSLNENNFEILYNMKEHLSRPNSVLIVIGYSGNDGHINKIISECAQHGLTVYRYKYLDNEKNIGAFEIIKTVNKGIGPEQYVDSSKECAHDFSILWSQQ